MSKMKVMATPSVLDNEEQVQSPDSAGGNVKWFLCFQNQPSSFFHI